jgi:hypothetical protein
MTIINLVTPKAAAKREFLFNKPASGARELPEAFRARIQFLSGWRWPGGLCPQA